MPDIDNNFQVSNRNIKTFSPKKPENYTAVSVPKEAFTEVKDIESLQFKSYIRGVYKDICKRIDLKEQIRPELEFDTLTAGAAGGFDNIGGKIIFDDSIIKDLDNKVIVFAIRHELQHVKQFHDMERLLGLEKFVELMVSRDENFPDKELINSDKVNIDYYKKVEQVLGKIDKDSPEGIRTQKYIDAYKKYPDLIKLWQRTDICKAKKIFLFAKEFIFNYKFNFLETDANKAAKKFLKTLKM